MNIYAGSLIYEPGFKRYYVRAKINGKTIYKYFNTRKKGDEYAIQCAQNQINEWNQLYDIQNLKIYEKNEKGVWKVDLRTKEKRYIKKFVVCDETESKNVKATAELYHKDLSDKLGLTIQLNHCPKYYIGWIGGIFDACGSVHLKNRLYMTFTIETSDGRIPEAISELGIIYKGTPNKLSIIKKSNGVIKYVLTFNGVYAQVLIEDLILGSKFNCKILSQALNYINQKYKESIIVSYSSPIKNSRENITDSYLSGIFDIYGIIGHHNLILNNIDLKDIYEYLCDNYGGKICNNTWKLENKEHIFNFLTKIRSFSKLKKQYIDEWISTYERIDK